MVKIAIVGLGDMGCGHLRGFDKFDNCEIVAVCDTEEKNLSRSKNFLRKSNPQFFTNYQDVLNLKELDAVVIAVPNYLHVDMAVAALDKNKDVFLEKPIAHTISDTDRIIEKFGETTKILQIGLVYRSSNLYRTIARMVEEGKFGEVMMMHCQEYRDNFPTSWFFDENKSGGAILDKDCHHFDIFNWYIKSQPVKVFAFGGQDVAKGENYKINCSYAPDKNLIVHSPSIVDHASVLVEYENGAKGNLGLCMYEIEPISGLEIGGIGNNGSHFLAKKDTSLIVGGGPLGETKEIEVDYFGDNEGIGHIGCQVERKDFLRCVEERIEPYANLYIGRQAMVVSFAAEKSIKEGRVVYISEYNNPKVVEIFKKRGYLEKIPTPPPATLPLKKEVKGLSFGQQLKTDLLQRIIGTCFFKYPLFLKIIARSLNFNKEYLKLSAGLNTTALLKHQEKGSIYIKIENGKISPLLAPVTPEVSITFTDESWKGLFLGENIQKLFLTRKIQVEGDISKLMGYTEAFLHLANKIK